VRILAPRNLAARPSDNTDALVMHSPESKEPKQAVKGGWRSAGDLISIESYATRTASSESYANTAKQASDAIAS
jgi:hypothetical protein